MLDSLRRRPVAAEDAAGPRAVLRRAQGAYTAAQQALQRAESTSERARAEVARLRGALAAHGDVDGAVTEHIAARMRTGNGGPAVLPPDLADKRRRQTASAQELSDGERVQSKLEQEAAELRQAAERARAALHAAVVAIEAEAAVALAGRIRQREQAAAADRLLLAALLVGVRTSQDPPLPWPAQSCVMEPAQALAVDGAAMAGKQVSPEPWREFRRQLATDAEAQFAG